MKEIESRQNGSVYGKCTERCDVPLAEDTNNKLMALVGMAGMTKAEYVRMLIERHVYGAADQMLRRDPLLGA